MNQYLHRFLFLCASTLLVTGCSGLDQKREERILKKVKEFDQLIVVHPTYYFDPIGEAKDSINLIANYFLKADVPISTLIETNKMIQEINTGKALGDSKPTEATSANYSNYFEKIRSTKLVQSKDGENDIEVRGTRIVVMGGYFAACLRTAVRDLVRNNRSETKTLQVFMPLDAIYGKNIARAAGPKSKAELIARTKKHLPKDTNLKFHINREETFSVDNSGKYNLEVFIRPPRKSVQETMMSF